MRLSKLLILARMKIIELRKEIRDSKSEIKKAMNKIAFFREEGK